MRAWRGPERLLAVTGLVVLGAGAAVVLSGRPADAAARHRIEVQRMTGGLGLGSTLDLSECAYGFDPRLDGVCAGRVGSLPGDDVTCPHHRGLLPPP